MIGYSAIGYPDFYWIYRNWISKLLLDIETLDIRTFIGYTNTGQNFIGYIQTLHMRTLLDIPTLDITAFT